MNESGSTTLLGVCLLLLFSYLGLTHLSQRIDGSKNIQHKQKVLLCAKELNGLTTKFINNISFTNSTLKYLTIGKYTSLLIPFPGLNLATKQGVARAITITKASQMAFRLQYLARLKKVTLHSCSTGLNSYQTPFTQRRDKFNQLIKRKINWKLKIKSGPFLIVSKINLSSRRTTSSIKKVNLLQRHLLL